jgi:uncharacterized protein (DUF2225 family)
MKKLEASIIKRHQSISSQPFFVSFVLEFSFRERREKRRRKEERRRKERKGKRKEKEKGKEKEKKGSSKERLDQAASTGILAGNRLHV